MDPSFVLGAIAGGALVFGIGVLAYAGRKEVNPFKGAGARTVQPAEKPPESTELPHYAQAFDITKQAPVPDRSKIYMLRGYPCHSWVIVSVPPGAKSWQVATPQGCTFCTDYLFVADDCGTYIYVRGYWLDDPNPAAAAAAAEPSTKDPIDA